MAVQSRTVSSIGGAEGKQDHRQHLVSILFSFTQCHASASSRYRQTTTTGSDFHASPQMIALRHPPGGPWPRSSRAWRGGGEGGGDGGGRQDSTAHSCGFVTGTPERDGGKQASACQGGRWCWQALAVRVHGSDTTSHLSLSAAGEEARLGPHPSCTLMRPAAPPGSPTLPLLRIHVAVQQWCASCCPFACPRLPHHHPHHPGPLSTNTPDRAMTGMFVDQVRPRWCCFGGPSCFRSRDFDPRWAPAAGSRQNFRTSPRVRAHGTEAGTSSRSNPRSSRPPCFSFCR